MSIPRELTCSLLETTLGLRSLTLKPLQFVVRKRAVEIVRNLEKPRVGSEVARLAARAFALQLWLEGPFV